MNEYKVTYKDKPDWPEYVKADDYRTDGQWVTFIKAVSSDDEWKRYKDFLTVTDVKRIELV